VQINEQYSERVQDCKHPRKSCDDSASRGESRPDGIFGKDTSSDRRKPMVKLDQQQPIEVREMNPLANRTPQHHHAEAQRFPPQAGSST
jgi:hypothetical protein